MQKKDALAVIDDKQSLFTSVSDKIWEYAELSLLEYQSMELYCKVLAENGFTVEKGLCNVPTAFSGSFGSGKPVIGILGEFDALSGLSQKCGVPQREERIPGGSGHGCGHNMLGAGSLAAAFAVKAYLEQTGKSGTVIFFGCPGEEGGAGKAFMARERAWEKLDAALSWHPGHFNQVTTGSCISCIQVEYKFTGIAAHAAGNPEQGRSALDAVQLMNIGVEFLREHMPDTARIHYAITDAGGNSPNVVQPTAQVLYMVRAPKVREAMKLQARVDKIAEAAAMMTETQLTRRFIDGTANTVSNERLEKLLYQNFLEVGAPTFNEEEKAFAQQLVDSYEMKVEGTFVDELEDQLTAEEFAQVLEKSQGGKAPLLDFIIPYRHSKKVEMGSTDVGDVSWLTPTAQVGTSCFAAGAPGHSWQTVSIGATSIGHKGLLCAGKVLAGAAIDLIDHPEILGEAHEEFLRKTKEGYVCPIPDDAVPTPVGDKM